MPRPTARFVALAAAVLVTLPAAAGDWTVTLHNGTEFVSRYQPEEASWDPDVVLLMTAEGNTIGLSQADIASVTSDIESRGFGTVIDDKTISLGWAPNDLPDPAAEAAASGLSPEMQLLQQMIAAQNQPAPAPNLNVQQFVDPSFAGGGLPAFGTPTGGVPFSDFGGFPGGGLGVPGVVTAPPSTAMPVPTASSLPAQGTSLPVQSSPVISP